MDRRSFLRTALVSTAGVTAFGSSFWRALASHPAPVPGPGPYGPLGVPDENGIRLPEGFRTRLLAIGTEPVPGIPYVWHPFPDGGATFAHPGGGWIYVSNSEAAGVSQSQVAYHVVGGASAMRFDADGNLVGAYRILAGTRWNCAGGATPWGTWLSCEEHDHGLVWECDPLGEAAAVPRPALGTFYHEAAVTDPTTLRVYMTEDRIDGLFYRFTPESGDPAIATLERGLLEAAKVDSAGRVSWVRVPNPNPIVPAETATRTQLIGRATVFSRGEGAWFDAAARTVYFCTTGDNVVWAYHVDDDRIEKLFDSVATPGSPLRGADNIVVSQHSRDVFIAEDGGNREIVVITPEGHVAPFLEATEPIHDGSELTGVAFDPSGARMYLSSQRGSLNRRGMTLEVTGPFRGA